MATKVYTMKIETRFSFSVEGYTKSVRDYQENWEALDAALYRLCKDHPGHDSRPSVYAKVFIIGRSYSSGIERLVPKTKEQPSGMTHVAERLIAHGRSMDRLFEQLRLISPPMTAAAWEQTVASHGQFVNMLKPITAEHSPRSFASKYLHFHCPIVPIYDSKAAWSLSHFDRDPESVQTTTLRRNVEADSDYTWLVQQFWNLYEQVLSSGHAQTVKHVKHIDHYLGSMADLHSSF
jgi:hypothetical protein